MFTRIRRILKTAFTNFYRNIWLSLTATLIMTLALITVGIFLILALATNKMTVDLKGKVDVVINFKDVTSEALIRQFQSELIARPNIKTVHYISKEEALKDFKSRQSVKSEIRDIISPEDNPLPRGVQIQSVDLSEYENFVYNLAKSPVYAPFIDSSSYDDNKSLITNIDNASRFVQEFGLILSGFFILVAILVVFNTVRLALLFRSKEIEVMRLVGASDSFVKVPFLIEGFLYGLFAVIFANVLIYLGMSVAQKISQGTVFDKFVQKLAPIYIQEIFFIIGIQLIVGVIIGVGSSYLSIRRNAKI